MGELLRALDGYQGGFVTRCALRLAPLLFVRPGELRKAEWAELDLNAAEWRIPTERDAVRAAYNYAEHLPERRKMMQAWADYLDSLKTGAEVVPLHGKLA